MPRNPDKRRCQASTGRNWARRGLLYYGPGLLDVVLRPLIPRGMLETGLAKKGSTLKTITGISEPLRHDHRPAYLL